MLTRSIFGNLFIIQIDSQGFLFMQLEPWRLPTIKSQGMCLPVIYSDLCREFSEDAVHGSHRISKVAHKLSRTLKVIKKKKKMCLRERNIQHACRGSSNIITTQYFSI
jgi:hypothetical protein